MDSLLDALTNVVGILLLVLILTSINMNAAVRKILSELMPVTPEQFEANKVLRDRKLSELDKLRASVDSFQSLESIQEKMAQLDLELDELKTDTSVADLREQLAALQAEIEKEKAKKETNEEKVNEASDELDRLLALLQDLENQEGPPPTVITLPAGRQARAGAEPRYVLCVGGRAYWVGDFYAHAIAVRKEIERNFSELVYSGSEELGSYTYAIRGDDYLRDRDRYDDLRPRNAEGLVLRRFRYDTEKVINHFQENTSKLGTPDVTYALSRVGDRLRLSVKPRPGGGAGEDELFQSGSQLIGGYKKTMRDELGNQNYLYFRVAPDSFDVYLAARKIADEKQIPNGWKPWVPGGTPSLVASVNPATHREFLQYEVNGIIPQEKLDAHARKMLPTLRENMEETQTILSQVQDPKLEPYVRRWANTFRSTYFDVERHIPRATPLFRGFETVLTEPQLPDVPLIRVFTKAPPKPTKVPKPRPPRDDQEEEEKEPTRDILD